MAKKKIRTPEDASRDEASIVLLQLASENNYETVFSRADAMAACPIGSDGLCCKVCAMGPCRLVKEGQTGVCGATVETVAARNFARMVAVGAASHSDHGRDLAYTLLAAAEGHAPDYKVRDPAKLREMAGYLQVEVDGLSTEELAREVALAALAEFGKPQGEIIYLKRAPAKRQEIWHNLGIAPRNIDREIVEILHRTHMGNDQDAEHIL
ncbi:MAG: hypothetical protein KAS19_02185, partial [Anaerolineales bacterium]|nr:hypothetical protein [Anaerolineales bacterium]